MIGGNFFFLNSVESTNNYAMANIHAGTAKHGDVYLAREQTAGKGQRGRSWNAEPGQNVTMTAVLDTAGYPVHRQFLLSAAIALATCDLLTKKLESGVTIKWPNDVYWRDRKAAGILIENIISGHDWKYAIAGIGVNVNQTSFTGISPTPVSLRQVTGKEWDITLLAAELCKDLENRWQQIKRNEEQVILHDYNQCLFKKNQLVKLKKDNVTFDSVIREVNKSGELVTENGGFHRYRSGELQWILPDA